MRIIKFALAITLGLIIAFILSLYFDVIWKSPGFYQTENIRKMEVPIMDMEAYKEIISQHRRPYCYTIKSKNGGKVYILGVEHTKDKTNAQFDTISRLWEEAKPTVALVEGRMGFLFSWTQDPIEHYGEGGLVSHLSRKDGVKLYTWEPRKEDEIKLLLQDFSAEQLAAFYSFRPYFGNMRHGKPSNPEEKLQGYLESRTDIEPLKGHFTSWQELDSYWQRHFPDINWRDYSDEKGWPSGFLSEIANASNLARDYHMVQAIADLVEKGETVFVTMGSSHAPRIEKSLHAIIE